MHSAPTAAIILIGNELLSGKIADRNAAYLTGRLHKMGVRVARILVIPDVLDTIAAEVRHHAGQYDHVFTSGGVGPTHDDITIEGVSAAFGVEVARDPLLTEILERHFQDRLTDAHLRMANVPSGAHLLHGGEITWPVVCFQNVYILPGVPEIFRAKFESIADRFRYKPMHVHAIYLNADDLKERGLKEGDRVDITSHFRGEKRIAQEFVLVPYALPRGCAGAYFPEANVLVPVDHVADKSLTPASKSIVITLTKRSASPRS